MTPHVCPCVCTSPLWCTPDEETLRAASEYIWQHLKQLLKVSNQTCRRGAFFVSETAHPSYMLIGPDQPFPYKGLMFVKCCVSVQLVQLRSPGWFKNSCVRTLLLVMLPGGAGEIQVKRRCTFLPKVAIA